MTSQLTVADCRIQIGSLFPTSEFIPLMNQANNRIIQSGRWAGALIYADFPTVPLGYITLPYELLGIMGVSIAGVPSVVFGNMHEYLISGPGHIDETKPAVGILDYINDGFPVRVDIPTDGSMLKIVLDNALDVGKPFRIYGNVNGEQIFTTSGMGYDFTTTGVTTTNLQVIDSVTGIQVQVNATTGASTMLAGWTLYAVSPTNVVTQLGYYYPNETRPAYARYKVGTWNTANDNAQLTIRTLCQRRFIPVAKETDWVIPGSIGALKAAMQAVQQEDAANYESAAGLWNYAMGVLNNEVHSARAGAKPEIQIPQSLWGGYTMDGGYFTGFAGCG